MSLTWDVELLTNTTANVRLRTTMQSTVETYSVTGGLSSLIPLLSSGLSLQVRDSVFTPGSGPVFRIDSLSRPTVDLGTILASVDTLGDAVTSALFGITTPAGREEPLRTFRHLYEDHHDLAHRLGAVVMALVYQTEARRSK